MRKKILTLFLISIATVISAQEISMAQSSVVNLNKGWQFYYDWQSGVGDGVTVDLPHTYNRVDAPLRADYFRGLTGYVRALDVPNTWRDKAVLLRVGGANSVADVYLDGRHVGVHRSGSTAFMFNLSPFLRYGARNMLQIKVNNAPSMDLAPLTGDYNQYGGLFRGVELLVKPTGAYIADLERAGSGVTITQMDVHRDLARINVVAQVNGTRGMGVDVKFVVRDGGGVVVDSMFKYVELAVDGGIEVPAMFEIYNPRLWDGLRDPYLYSVDVSVSTPASTLVSGSKASAAVADVVSEQFGLRFFEIDRQNRFMLNGKALQIRGVVLHPDWQGLGNALYAKNYERDLAIILDMGANAVRVSGGVVDPYFATLCDRAGVLLWCELPFTGPASGSRAMGYNDSPEFTENIMAMASQMVGQLYNHPSIVFWGIFSEISRRGDDPLSLVRQLNQFIKAEDGQRLTAASSNQDGEINFVTDVIGFAPTFGWESGMPTDIVNWTAQLRKDWPNLRAGLSSYGAGGYGYHDADSLLRPVVKSTFHPQQWQSYLHETYWREIARQGSGLWGGFIGNMFDYSSPNAFGYPLTGVNDCGMVSYDRALRKEAFYFYKAAWSQTAGDSISDGGGRVPFAYIARPLKSSIVADKSRRDFRAEGRESGDNVAESKVSSVAQGSSDFRDVKVYSNVGKLELLVDGRIVGVAVHDQVGVFLFKDVKIKKGENNRLSVRSLDEKMPLEVTMAYDL